MGQGKENIYLRIEMMTVVNYALQQNSVPVIQEIKIENATKQDITDVTIQVQSSPAIVCPFALNIAALSAGESYSIREPSLVLDGAYLAGLTERINVILQIFVKKESNTLASFERSLTVLAFDEWPGITVLPELLTAFILPNHSEVVQINAKAAKFLEQWSGDPSLDAYQSRDPNRARLQAAAIYGALQAQNIVYSVPPASFEAIGQRIRLCDAVMQQKMGTCMDLTLLYAACLEAAGLHPLLLLQPGHIFAGVWLEDLTFPEAIQDDPSLITKRLADGVNEIAVVECTAFTAGKGLSFEQASSAAEQKLTGGSLDCLIDVFRARLSGIHPLPLRVLDGNQWTIARDEVDIEKITKAPASKIETVRVLEGHPENAGKMAQWERKLLDLGMRNTLLNLRLTRTVIPILSPSLRDLVEALVDRGEFGIASRPDEWSVREEDQKDPEKLVCTSNIHHLIKCEFHNMRLRTSLSEGELARSVIHLYRSARTALEENGANTLYLAIGLLRWYETKTSQTARYAPVVLLPVEIVRKSALKGYVIRSRSDEEPQINVTLLEKLKQDFEITISGLDPLPQDENGLDIRLILVRMRRAIMDQRGWDVLETAVLGVFSFSQFVMWNDIRNRAEDLQKNRLVRSLMDGKLAWMPPAMQLGACVPEEGVLLPIPADASQLYAIEAAARGESFVLHGPPGTGKSQTITAMIANAVAQGKTVLFVAEKMAALSVVQRRLEEIGIGPFCLELHSNKSQKHAVLEQLRMATEIANRNESANYKEQAEQAAQMRKELDAYARSLHQKRASGLSLFEMISGYEKCRLAPDTVHFSDEFAFSANCSVLAKYKLLIGQLIAAGKAIGHPYGNPLRLIPLSVYTQQLHFGLPNALISYRSALEQLEEAGTQFSEALDRKVPDSLEEWKQLYQIAEALMKWIFIPRAWAKDETFSYSMQKMREMSRHYQKARELSDDLNGSWNKEFLKQDGEALLTQWRQISSQWFLTKALGQNKIESQLSPFARRIVNKTLLERDLERLVNYQKEQSAANELFTFYKEYLEPVFKGEDTDWKQLETQIEQALHDASELAELTGGEEMRLRFAARKELQGTIGQMIESYSVMQDAKSSLYSLLEVYDGEWGPADWLHGQLQFCNQMEKHIEMLRDWILWNRTCQEIEKEGLGPLVRAYENGLEHENVESACFRGIYKALIEHTIDEDPALLRFSGAMFNEKIQQFKQMDQKLQKLAKVEIYNQLTAKMPHFELEAVQSSEVGILQRAIRSGGRGISIRRLFEQIPELLTRLCPCMLMSPISAAQYLNPKCKPFDIVVFDEASQMPTCKAVGAIARGKSAVIVGDPKQMPPTSFFSGNTVDEDNLQQEDLESILDDCLAIQLPQAYLLWHYRSHHESLISFSNSQFYENKLYTFPSADDLASKVSLVHVEGFFDRGKTRQNKAEAKAVIHELQRRCHNPVFANQSVGVVTFNITQQSLIEDLLTDACKEDADLEDWAYNRPEPLFIKNLENVQGDERDVVLFSVGYGPDEQGRITMNFGPLNRDGGWCRLNVAVSRAREEMIVFSTITAEQINLSRCGGAGVAALKAFLRYANGERIAEQKETGQEHTIRNGIADMLCCKLTDEGYETRTMIGRSDFRIDVGVVDPSQPKQYLLGILLDGPMYGAAKTTRDREIARADVLKKLGWELHRIWSIDWWINSQKEFDRLLEHIKQTVESRKKLQADPEYNLSVKSSKRLVADSCAQYAPCVQESCILLYEAASLAKETLSSDAFLLPQYDNRIKEAFEQVLSVEAPIRESLLIRRVLQSFGFGRTGARLQERAEILLKQMGLSYTMQRGEKFYWRNDQNPDTYSEFRQSGIGNHKRDAQDLPVEEVSNAVCRVLQDKVGLQKEDLIRETARLLGYARSGNVVVEVVTYGIKHALKTSKILVDDTAHLYNLKQNR
ncbi:DUF3320 domain-containing protein [Anaeromassilibacillus senegalensis]|uniref:DUF3320 domain-containing protein n=1 Tax=Anaeromassilibacillus senegalensis TaxID=1673717 RepID=UPI000682F5CF|nr:DUF3320 domain-containing protein [Anaeromassilibacillus senegalensis]